MMGPPFSLHTNLSKQEAFILATKKQRDLMIQRLIRGKPECMGPRITLHYLLGKADETSQQC